MFIHTVINNQNTITMSLEKRIGAKFLVDAKLKSVYEQSLCAQIQMNLPEDYIKEMIERNMLNSTSKAISERFKKEIKLEKIERHGLIFDRYELEFMAFTMPEFKYIIEYVISEMTMEQLIEIQNKHNDNATNSNL